MVYSLPKNISLYVAKVRILTMVSEIAKREVQHEYLSKTSWSFGFSKSTKMIKTVTLYLEHILSAVIYQI